MAKYILTFDLDKEITCYGAFDDNECVAGLTKYPNLPLDEGLWMVFPDPEHIMIWNRGVKYDIDVAFISEEMKVVDIKRLEENSSEIVQSAVPCKFVVEARAGRLEELEIGIGSLLVSNRKE